MTLNNEIDRPKHNKTSCYAEVIDNLTTKTKKKTLNVIHRLMSAFSKSFSITSKPPTQLKPTKKPFTRSNLASTLSTNNATMSSLLSAHKHPHHNDNFSIEEIVSQTKPSHKQAYVLSKEEEEETHADADEIIEISFSLTMTMRLAMMQDYQVLKKWLKMNSVC